MRNGVQYASTVTKRVPMHDDASAAKVIEHISAFYPQPFDADRSVDPGGPTGAPVSPAVEEPVSAMRHYKTGLFHQLVKAAKVRILREALRRYHGNRTHTAQALGLPICFV